MEYLGQSAIVRLGNLFKPSLFWSRKRFRLTLRLPPEKINADTVAQAKAMLSKYCATQISDNQNRIRIIHRKGMRQIPYSMTILIICISLGLFFGLEQFLELKPILASALSEGFYIIGWVALWGPIDTLLFEPMEVRRESKVLKLLGRIEIEVVPQQGN